MTPERWSSIAGADGCLYRHDISLLELGTGRPALYVHSRVHPWESLAPRVLQSLLAYHNGHAAWRGTLYWGFEHGDAADHMPIIESRLLQWLAQIRPSQCIGLYTEYGVCMPLASECFHKEAVFPGADYTWDAGKQSIAPCHWLKRVSTELGIPAYTIQASPDQSLDPITKGLHTVLADIGVVRSSHTGRPHTPPRHVRAQYQYAPHGGFWQPECSSRHHVNKKDQIGTIMSMRNLGASPTPVRSSTEGIMVRIAHPRWVEDGDNVAIVGS